RNRKTSICVKSGSVVWLNATASRERPDAGSSGGPRPRRIERVRQGCEVRSKPRDHLLQGGSALIVLPCQCLVPSLPQRYQQPLKLPKRPRHYRAVFILHPTQLPTTSTALSPARNMHAK